MLTRLLLVLAAFVGLTGAPLAQASKTPEFTIVDFSGTGSQRDALEEGLEEAGRVLRKRATCRALFGATDPFWFIQAHLDAGLIQIAHDYESRESGALQRKEFRNAGVGAVTAFSMGSLPCRTRPGERIAAARITLNARGFYFTLRDTRGNPIEREERGGMYRLSRSGVRGAVILHEMLHAANRIPSDGGNPEQSQANSETVRKSCFLSGS